jgi:hypothetical protein
MLPVKYFPVILLFWFLWKKQWKAATATIVTAAAVTVVSLIVMGPEVFRTFITSVLPDHLRSRYSHQSPYAVAFQSWDSLLMRLFVWNAEENPAPLADAPGVYLIVKWLILLAGAACTGWLAVRAGQTSSPGAAEGLLAFLGIGSLLLAPGTATYHFVLLWLPLALLLKLHGGSAALRRIAVFSYVAIGWIPYSWFRVAEQAGGAMMVFAYPRLLLLTILFIATLRLVGRSPSPVVPQGALA